MKRLRHLALSLLLVLSLATTAFATEVPESLVVENLNGQQRIVKTYVLSPETDPEVLKEPSFDYDGFTYTWAYTTKAEKEFLEAKTVVETVTVETSKKDLSEILAALAPTIPYDDGEFVGELALDHTTLATEAAGYTTGTSTVTATKTIGPLNRNDMSYVPATTVKNGITLSLSNVEWQVIGTDLIGDVLAPPSYQAVATYSGKTSYKTATGYVTTAEYRGEVTSSGVESITYTVVYVGTEIVTEALQPTQPTRPGKEMGSPVFGGNMAAVGGVLLMMLSLAVVAGLGIYLFLHRKNVFVYVPGERPRDYKLVAKFRVEPKNPEIDVSQVDISPARMLAVEIKRPLATKLINKIFTVQHEFGRHRFMVLRDNPGEWHEFVLNDYGEEEFEL